MGRFCEIGSVARRDELGVLFTAQLNAALTADTRPELLHVALVISLSRSRALSVTDQALRADDLFLVSTAVFALSCR